MSVRRLAEDTLQPEGFKFDRANAAEAKGWIRKYPKGRQHSAVIPLLMLAQDQEGWVTRAAIEHVAEMLDMPLIRVMEVATFYTQFQLEPVGTKAHVQVCGTTPCMLRGAEELMAVCQRKINERQFVRNDAGTLSWEEVECQGACVNAPMVIIGRDAYEDLTPERLEEIIDAFEAGKGDEIEPGPQIDRIYSAPVTGLTSLLDDDGKKPASSARKAPGTTSKPGATKGPGAARAEPGTAKPKTGKVSPTAAIASTASAVRPGKKQPAKSVAEGNPTMKLAATASGRAKKPPKRSELTGSESPAAAAQSRAAGRDTPETAPKGPARTRKPAKGAPAATARGAASDKTVKAASQSGAKASGAAMRDPVVHDEMGSLREDRNRPAAMERPAAPDDLKLISGVGPKLEEKLNGLGIFTFGQIAKWKKAEREWVDGYLSFKGRIERDDWIKQAKALAKGGVDEYVRVFGKKPR
ncbi:MAG: NADH-quinone oxidoreductase subunit NuoE [Roseitalea porphyridii]|uniref:NADH-quinone oxidoreductase subunit NuoE n=1 Tax=Roseitalea porphyridii TaxID=1852022 RepID=UPI0032D905EE